MSELYQLSLLVNGKLITRDVPARLTLVDFLRQTLGLTGTHVGCEHGVCGACTVLLNGATVRACLMFAIQAQGCDLTTIEGLTPTEGLSSLQQQFCSHHAMQCGFCTPGMVVTGEALLRRCNRPDAVTVREAISGNICRCTGYQPIVQAILAEGEQRSDSQGADYGQ